MSENHAIAVEDVEFGIDSFGDIPRRADGELVSHAEAIRATLREAVIADETGIDIIALGEHHRPDFSISTPETVLAGIATATKNIRLSSAVTVLSSDDPVRVFQRFATVDALSNGRAEIILGRGSFTESFPLFGFDLADYEVLFEEKLELFKEVLTEEPVTWSGTTRAALNDADIYPKTESGNLRTWVGVGGSPQSVIRTAHHGFRLMLAIIGGSPDRFLPYIDLYRRATDQFGTTVYPVGMHSPGFVAESDAEAVEIVRDEFKIQRDRIGAERGWPPMRPQDFTAEVEGGSLYVGSPETVAQKMARAIRTLGVGRFDLMHSGGALPADARLRSVELYGSLVIPRVREILTEDPGALAGR